MQLSSLLVALAGPFLGLTQAAALHPKDFITVELYGDNGKYYTEKVWPDGDEHWFNEGRDEWKRGFKVEFIKFYSTREDSAIRCLPTESHYPWKPLRVKLFQLPDKDGYKVHGLYLAKPQPVEVLRCDLP